MIPAVGVNENGSGEAYRLNLEIGRYMRSYEIDIGGDDLVIRGGALQGGIDAGSVNVAAIAESTHSLLAFGTSLGTVEFWDPRSKNRIGVLQTPPGNAPSEPREEITALEFDHTGLGIAAGSSTGLVRLYDLRSPVPVLKKDQGYGYPIQNIIYLDSSASSRSQNSEPKILSADKRIIKIWNAQDGSPWTSVEPAVDMNSVAWYKDSGMILTANEGRQQHSFFIPQLGPAPKWCSFLDNLVEEMAEDPDDLNAFAGQQAGSVYDNYKFLTPSQLENLNLSHLVGTTGLLRPYMHGYFVAQRLYEEARLISDPFVWEEERNKRVKEKIDSERESRIRGSKKINAKINKRLAEKLLDRQEREERRQARHVLENGGDQERDLNGANAEVDTEVSETPARSNLLADPRFAKLFEDKNYAIDESSREFRVINPSTKLDLPSNERGSKDDGREERGLTAVEEEAVMDLPGSASDSSDLDDVSNDVDGLHGRIPRSRPSNSSNKSRPAKQRPQMQVTSSKRPGEFKDRSFGSRSEKLKKEKSHTNFAGGEKQITFAPRGKIRKPQREGNASARRLPKPDRRSASGNVFRKL